MSKFDIENMEDEEARAHVEAAQLGQLHMIMAALEALVAVSPQPDFIQFRLAQNLAAIENTKAERPELEWYPPVMIAGAQAAAKRLLAACQANMDRPKPKPKSI